MPVSGREEGTQQIPKQWELDPVPLNLKMEATYFYEITDVKYIHIECQSAEDYTLANPRRENFKSDTFTMCLLAAVILHIKCVYI
jgi:hypothetical protein